jgi:two-component system chemotaxis response regulator CheB
MSGNRVIVIGASAGGVQAVKRLVNQLPADLQAPVFVVIHTSPQGPGYLPEILKRAGKLPARHPADTEAIHKGCIYVAPPDRHLIILDEHVCAVLGPKESRHRPAVDTLFRTAAAIYGARVIGVVLTGALDDGTAGLQAIKEQGGTAIVQDPTDAEYPSMPRSALRYVKVDHCLPLAEIAPLLAHLALDPINVEEKPGPTEVSMTAKAPEEGETICGFTCPECRASLWQSRHGDLQEFRCRVGHTFSPETLLAAQSDLIEQSLWSALNLIEERTALMRRLAAQPQSAWPDAFAAFVQREKESTEHARCLRRMLVGEGDWYGIGNL